MKHFRSDGDYKNYKTYKLTPVQMASNPCVATTNPTEDYCISISCIKLDIPEECNKIGQGVFQLHADRINQWLAMAAKVKCVLLIICVTTIGECQDYIV
jgi:hypothetical protein